MSSIYGRTLLDTLHERVGEEEQLRARSDLDDGGFNGTWGRVLVHDGHRDGDGRGIYGGEGPRYKYDLQAVQVGMDLYRSEDEDDHHRDHAGLYLAFGRGEGEVRHNYTGFDFHAGYDAFDARTLGAYWTRFSPQGRYFDLITQATWYDLTARSLRLPENTTDGLGLALSAEGGYPFELDHDWRLEPQGQIIYQHLRLDDIQDPFAHIRFDDTDSLAARIGARLHRTWEQPRPNADPRQFSFWLRGNLWYEFLGDPQVEFSSQTGYVPFHADMGGAWAELGFGWTAQMSRSTYFYADLDYSASLDGNDWAINGKLGIRVNW